MIHLQVVNGSSEDEIKKGIEKIEKYHNNVKLTSQTAEKKTVNGLDIYYLEGTGDVKKNNKPADWMLAYATNLKSMVITVMATDTAQEKYKEEIRKILNSIQKL